MATWSISNSISNLLIEMKSIEIIVSGKVQGVFFRASTEHKARALNITGIVRNMPDKTVLIRATGNDSALDELVAWCQIGSAGAQVAEVSTKEIPLQEVPEKPFKIVR